MAAGEHPHLPPVHVGELFSHVDIDPENVHIPRGDVPREQVDDDVPRATRTAIRARRRDRLPDPRHRARPGTSASTSRAPARESRTRLVTLDPVTRTRRRRRLLRRGERPARGDHDGRRDDPRGARDRDPRHRRAQGDDRPARRRGRGRPRGRRDVPAAAPEHDVLPRPRRRPPSSPGSRRRGCSARCEWTDAARGARRRLALAADRARRSSSSPSATTPSTSCRRWSRATASPGAVNGVVFNALGAKIRGRSKLPRGAARSSASRRIPTTTSSRWAASSASWSRTRTTITVAYMTSGNIAVFDHDVRRYVDFLRAAAPASGGIGGASRRPRSRRGSRSSSRASSPGDVDIPEVQDIKRDDPRVRGGERASRRWASTSAPRASSTCRSTRRARCGRTRSARRTWRSCATLLEEIEPDLIFVAGDLSDPHGTHRMCKEAIDRALERERRGRHGRGPRCGSTAARGRSGR